jgi:hypothetical protein
LRAWASRYSRWLSFGLRISAGNWSANIQAACWAIFPAGDALGTTMMVLIGIARISLLSMPDTNSLLALPPPSTHTEPLRRKYWPPWSARSAKATGRSTR